MKKVYLRDRVKEEADYIISTTCTIRECARKFGVSKSCIHHHMRKKLPNIDSIKYNKVRKVFDYNISQRHIRGGAATQAKYLKGE